MISKLVTATVMVCIYVIIIIFFLMFLFELCSSRCAMLLLCNILIALCVLVISDHGAVVHWSRTRALVVLILATILMAACADLSTEHIKPIISNSSVSQVQTCIFNALFY